MGRAKLKMELITKERTRNTTYHKRKQGMIKKANEFTILCDVDTVMIIFPPYSNEPEIWPENPNKIKKTIAAYNAKKDVTRKRTYDLHDFYEDRKKKIEGELIKARKKNMEAKYATWFNDLDVFTELQLRQFVMELENKENVVRACLEFKKRNMSVQLANMVHQYQGLGTLDHNHGTQVMMNQHFGNHDGGWFGDAHMGYGCYNPVFANPNQWVYPAAATGVQGGVLPEFVRQEYEPKVNVNGVGEFVMDDHLGKIMRSF